MDCTKVRKLLSSYIDSELTKFENSAVEKHVSVCGKCKDELGELYKLRTFMKGSFHNVEEVDFSSSIMRKIKAEDPSFMQTETPKIRSISKKRKIKPFIAAALMFAVAGAAVISNDVSNNAVAESDRLENYVYQHMDTGMQVDYKNTNFVLVASE